MSDILNSLLDAQLDDLADLPEYGVYPAGAHKVTISFDSKEINQKPAVSFNFDLVETLELSNPADTPIKAGHKGSVLFFLDNEFGQGALKKVLVPLAQATGASSMREIMEQSKGMEVTIITTAKPDKKDASIMRQGVSKVIVA